ncbi:MAG: elongation factor G [bacterium]
MKEYTINDIRNIGIAGHGGTGKTSLTEALLFTAKAVTRLGRVDQGTTTTDYDENEIERKISINSVLAFCDWKGTKINIIDTPGDANFFTDTKFALLAVDNIVIVVDGVSGVKVQTQNVWNLSQEHKLPGIFFINKLEKERADFFKVSEEIMKKFNSSIPVQMPVGSESKFSGLVDLIKNKAYEYTNDESGTFKEIPVPDNLKNEVKKYRELLIEKIAETDDVLLEKYLEKGEISDDEMKSALIKAVTGQKIVPIVCGSALRNIGVAHLFDTIAGLLPCPAFRKKITGTNSTGALEEREQADSAPFSAFVFKTLVDPHSGHVSLFRVFSGTANSDSMVYNPAENQKERLGHVCFYVGKNAYAVSKIIAGDIGGVTKLKKTFTGQTLCDEKHPIILPSEKAPDPAIFFAIEPKSRADEEKMSSSIAKLIEEDPSLKFSWDPQTKESILGGAGQLEIEIDIEKLKRKFGVEVLLKPPHIPYKETIKAKFQAQGKYKRQSGGRGQYGDAWLELEPMPRGKGFEFNNRIVGGVIPRQYIPAVEKGVIESMNEGILAGYPVVDVRVSVYDGSYHDVDSSEMAFKIAGSMAFKKAMEQAKPVILEPIMNMEVIVPEECVGDIMGDLNSRRGRVHGVEPSKDSSVIKAEVPMAEMLRYAPDLKSITGGRGNYHMQFSHYEEVPAHLKDKIINEAKKEKEEKAKS